MTSATIFTDVQVELFEWADQIHGFVSMLGAIDAANAALDHGARALREAFASAR